ncbi:MAG TPA: DNA-3-methyladenine glycosylase I [Sedimentisphaerales bacterium]|nr:DNA-3-methyladenine glycosylase I [Sedimentisphaerales bacterium]
MRNSCDWPGENKLMIEYHDTEWGVPTHNDLKLFEFLLLDNAQAGLSWQTILNKRENYRKAFDNFDPVKIARYNKRKITSLLNNPGIIRNRLKVESSVTNARAFLEIQKEFGSFDTYIWQFVNGTTIRNKWKMLKDIPATSAESDAMSKDLKKRPFIANLSGNVQIENISKIIDPVSLKVICTDAAQLTDSQVASVKIKLDSPICVDPFDKLPELGRFAIVQNGRITGGGVVK